MSINKNYPTVKSNLNFIFLSIFLIVSTGGLLFPVYDLNVVISIFGFFSTLYVFSGNFKLLYHKKLNLGITILLLGCLFWFWKELIIISLDTPSFSNNVSYSPFSTKRIPVDIISKSLFSLASFTFFAYSSWILFRKIKIPSWLVKSHERNGYFIELSILFLALLGWIPFANEYGGLAESIIKLSSFRAEKIELEEGLVNYLPILSIVASSYAFMRLTNGISTNKRLTIIAFISGGLIAFLSGTRFKLIYLILPSILALLASDNRRINPKRKMFIISVIFILMIAFALYQILNRYGENSMHSNAGILTAAAGGDHFSALTHAVALGDKLPSYFNQPMLSLFITDFIPRMFWPDKPIHLYWEYYNDELAIAGNITPSVLGQYYMNWGVFGGIIAGINFGLFARIADNYLIKYQHTRSSLHIAMACFIATFLFLSFRVYSFNYFFYLLILTFFCHLFSRNYKIC